MLLFNEIKKIAKENPEGFTRSLIDLTTPKAGFCVGMKMTQNSFGDEGLRKAIDIALESTFLVGGWLEKGQFYFDCVMLIHDEETARMLGKLNNQRAIYNLNTGLPIYLD